MALTFSLYRFCVQHQIDLLGFIWFHLYTTRHSEKLTLTLVHACSADAVTWTVCHVCNCFWSGVTSLCTLRRAVYCTCNVAECCSLLVCPAQSVLMLLPGLSVMCVTVFGVELPHCVHLEEQYTVHAMLLSAAVC